MADGRRRSGGRFLLILQSSWLEAVIGPLTPCSGALIDEVSNNADCTTKLALFDRGPKEDR